MSFATSDSIAVLLRSETVQFVVRSLVRLGARADTAEDLAQDVLLTALVKAEAFDASRAVEPWLWGIARNRLRDHRDLVWNRRVASGADQALASEAVAEAEGRDEMLAHALRRALATLEEDEQILVVLHELESWTLAECASALGISLDAAKYRLASAKATLRKRLATIKREGADD